MGCGARPVIRGAIEALGVGRRLAGPVNAPSIPRSSQSRVVVLFVASFEFQVGGIVADPR